MYGIANPHKEYMTRFAFNAPRQHVKISNTPSTIDQTLYLDVRLPNLGANDVILPESLKLTFDIKLNSTDTGRYIVNNLGKALIEQLTISYEGNIIQDIQNADVMEIYKDRWLPEEMQVERIQQGIDPEGDVNKLRVTPGATSTSTSKSSLAAVHGNRFSIPLWEFFELVKHLPYVQLRDRLSFKIKFAEYGKVIRDAGSGSGASKKDPDGTYTISNIALEFDKVEDSDFKLKVYNELANRRLPYTRVLRHRIIPLDKKDTAWNIQVNVPSESLKALVLFFLDPDKRKAYAMDNTHYYNPKISKVDITIEGEPNQLYTQGLLPEEMYAPARKYFTSNELLPAISPSKFFDSNYCLFIDFRSVADNTLHGAGRRLKNTSDGVTLQITKKADGAGAIQCYLFVLQDGQVNFMNERFHSVGY